jgi:hypothetical protein
MSNGELFLVGWIVGGLLILVAAASRLAPPEPSPSPAAAETR